jgi:hypothetical protein
LSSLRAASCGILETCHSQLAAWASVTVVHGAARGPRTRRGLGLVGGYEGEQLGDGPQIVVDQPGVDRAWDPAVLAAVAAVGRIGVPPAERRGLTRCGSRVGQDVAGVVEGDRQPPVEAVQASESFLADGGPAQRAGLQHRA